MDYDALEILPKDFFSEELRKWSVDSIYLLPLLNGAGTMPLALMLEHKAQGSPLDNAANLAQTLTYVALYCRNLVAKRRAGKIKGSLLQPISVVVYTGSDVDLEELNWEDYFQLPDAAAQFRIRFPIRFVNMTRLSQEKKLHASPFLRAAYDLMALASLGKLEGAESTVLSPLRNVVDWGERESDLLGAMAVYFLKSAINAKIPVDNSTVETLFESTNQGDKKTTKSVLAEIGEEIVKNERKLGREDGLRIAIDSTTFARFNKRSRKLSADVKRVSNFDQLNSILTYTLAQATSINDVIAYVGSLQ